MTVNFFPMAVAVFETTREDLEQFFECLEHHVQILDATVGMRSDFQDIVESQDNLHLVHLPTWAGLGAVQLVHLVFIFLVLIVFIYISFF